MKRMSDVGVDEFYDTLQRVKKKTFKARAKGYVTLIYFS